MVISIPAFFFFPLFRTFCSSVIADTGLTASKGPGKMASSRLPILIALAFSSLPFVLSHSNRVMWFQDFFPPNVCPINAKANTFYGIMFDAGSTGTRIHIYTFVQKSPGKTPMYVDFGFNFSKQFCFLPAQHLGAAEDFYSLSFKWSSCRCLLSICLGGLLCKYLFCRSFESQRYTSGYSGEFGIFTHFHLCSCLKGVSH